MQAVRRVLRSVMTVLVLGVWSATSIGAAVADAALSSTAAIGAHVEAPGAGGDHAAAHGDDCAFCQALQWTGDVVHATSPTEAQPSDSRVSVGTTTASGRSLPARAAARAPPTATT